MKLSLPPRGESITYDVLQISRSGNTIDIRIDKFMFSPQPLGAVAANPDN